VSVSKKVRRYRGWIAAGALMMVAGVAYLLLQQASTPEATTSYTTEQASVGTISVTVSATGYLEIDEATEVYASGSGTVASLEVAEGDLVATGTVLFTLDARDAKANTAKALTGYRQAQQAVAQAEASLVRATNSLADLEDSYAARLVSGTSAQALTPTETAGDAAPDATTRDAPAASSASDESAVTTQQTEDVTQADLDTAEAEVASAEAGVASARASLASALLSYEQAQEAEQELDVTAPCAGVVHSLGIKAGDTVSSAGSGGTSDDAGSGTGTTAATSSGAPVVLVPEQPFAARLTVNEVDLPSVRVGQRADIAFDALPDLAVTGKVYEIADEGTNEQGVVTFDVWLALDVADEALRSGMSTAASIVTDIGRDVVLVPNAAVKTDSAGTYYVQVLDEGAAEPRNVTVEIGIANATQTVIVSGVDEGDAVVTQAVESGETDEEAAGGGGFVMPGMGGGPGAGRE